MILMKNIQIAGMLPLSMIDFPGHLAAVIFTQGCEYQCQYCHNVTLQPFQPGNLKVEEILNFLETRKELLDGVVITGGEPLFHEGLGELIDQIQSLGFLIGLHTSGSYPYHLSVVAPKCDWIGFDYKAPMSGYGRITGHGPSGEVAQDALKVLIESKTLFEVRTTWHPAFLSYADLAVMAEELLALGIHNWVIQLFKNTQSLTLPPFGLDTGFVHEMFKIGMNIKVR